jgi:hypothetical protein
MAKYYKCINRSSIMQGQILIALPYDGISSLRVTAATHAGEKILRTRTVTCRGWVTDIFGLELLNMDEVV